MILRCVKYQHFVQFISSQRQYRELTPAVNKCYLSGDARTNQQPPLTTIHTVYHREHNRIVAKLAEMNPSWNDEKLFQEGRRILGAMTQHIIYNEYLLAILGDEQMTQYGLHSGSSGYENIYDETIDPSVRNAFAASAFRFGHSMIRDSVQFTDQNGVLTEKLLKDTFNRPETMYEQSTGVDSVARGLCQHAAQRVDKLFTDQIATHLLERLPGKGLDLVAINIQRGRDHGLPSYNQWRKFCGLPMAKTFTNGFGGFIDHTSEAVDVFRELYS